MKIESKFFEISISIKELNQIISDYVGNSGFVVEGDIINPENLKNVINNGELIINATKIKGTTLVEDSFNKIIFYDRFVSQLSASLSGVGLFVKNIDETQLQDFLMDAFSKLPEENKSILIFSYNLDNSDPLRQKRVSRKVVNKKFGTTHHGEHSEYKSLSMLSSLLFKSFTDGLKNKSLRLRHQLSHAEIMEMPLTEAGFSNRTFGCLEAADIKKTEELVSRSENDFLNFRNFGKSSIKEVRIFKQLYKI